MTNRKLFIYSIFVVAFILFSSIFLFFDWAMIDDWSIYKMIHEDSFVGFETTNNRFLPAYWAFFWILGKIFGGYNIFIYFLFQNILLLISLVLLYKFTRSLTEDVKIPILIILLFLSFTAFGTNFYRLGAAEAKLLPFFIGLIAISFIFIFKRGKIYHLILIFLLFLVSILFKESVVFILPSYVAFLAFLYAKKEKVLYKRTFLVAISLIAAFMVRMAMFYYFGGENISGRYVRFFINPKHIFDNLLIFIKSPVFMILIFLNIYLFYRSKRNHLVKSIDIIQIIFLALITFFPLSILLAWKMGPRPYLILPFAVPVLLILVKLFKKRILTRTVVLIIITSIILGNILNTTILAFALVNNNTYQKMLSSIAENITCLNHRILSNLDRGTYIEIYYSMYYYLKYLHNRKNIYIGSFMPINDKETFNLDRQDLAKKGLRSFIFENRDNIRKGDILVLKGYESSQNLNHILENNRNKIKQINSYYFLRLSFGNLMDLKFRKIITRDKWIICTII